MNRFIVRRVIAKDAEQIANLLKELGYPNSKKFAQSKIKKLTKSHNDLVLVAEKDQKVIGLTHLHIAELFHEKGKLGRIMAFVINKNYQRIGIGKKLIKYLEKFAQNKGCVKMEVTSNIHRNGAHKFYNKLGYLEKPKRFIKLLS